MVDPFPVQRCAKRMSLSRHIGFANGDKPDAKRKRRAESRTELG
jgi:hypothetical protein